MAGVTRKEFDALKAANDSLAKRVAALELAIRPVEPINRVVTATANPSAGSVQVSWTATDADSVTSWLVGRDGTDTAGAPAWSATEPAASRGRLFLKLRPAEYTFTVTATYADGEQVTGTVTATPAADVTPGPVIEPTDAPGERRVPLVSARDGGSGLPFNRLVFLGAAPSLKAIKAFETQVGGRVDGALTFPPRASWGDFRGGYGDAKTILDAGGIVVYSIPHAPAPTNAKGEYTAEAYKMNVRGADDAYREQQRELGKWWAGNGFNLDRFVVRVDWEFNGDWYPWSAKNGGPAALKASLRHFVTNVRAGGATHIRFDLCANKGPSQSGAHFPEVFPGADIIDVIAIDQYDQWAPAFTEADWAREQAKAPTAAWVADFAAQQGIQWAWDEGGNSHDAKAGGKDNPVYWRFRRAFLDKHAANCAWDNTYAHAGAPASLRHDWAANPASLAEYRRLYVA